MKKIINKFLWVLAGLFFVLILLEIATRLTGFIYRSRYESSSIANDKTNSTILCLGDSHTRGMGAPEGFDYPTQLGNLLNESSIRKYRVVNEGLVNQNTSQLLIDLPSLITKYKPELIIIMTGADNKKWNYYGYNSRNRLSFIFKIRVVKLFYLILNNIQEKSILSETFSENFIPEDKTTGRILSSLLRQLKNNPSNDHACYKIGQLYISENKCNEALVYFKKAIQINKHETRYFFAISNAYKLTGSYSESLKYLEDGLELNHGCDYLLLEGAKIFIEKADYGKALSMIEKGIISNPLCINFYQYLNSLRSINEIKPDIDTFYSNHKINTSENYYFIHSDNNNNEFSGNKLRNISKDDEINKKWIKSDLVKIVNTARERNVKLMFINYYFNDIANNILQEISEENNIPFVDNYEVFSGLGKEIMKYREPIGYGFGGHPNSKGYELIARNIYNEMQKQQILQNEKKARHKG